MQTGALREVFLTKLSRAAATPNGAADREEV